jgi:transposase
LLAATAASHTKNTYLGSQFARLASRRGRKRAAVAVAHSILVSAYYMLTRDEPYHDLGPQWFHHSDTQARTRRLVAQLEVLGHTVVLDPAS